MDFKKIGKRLLFPPKPLLILLVPTSGALLAYSMIKLDEASYVRIASYVLAFYALITVCAVVPSAVKGAKSFKSRNRYAKIWFDDARLRVNVSLAGTFLWNAVYGLFQLSLGVIYKSAWYYSLSGYYVLLAVVRILLARYSFFNKPGKDRRREYSVARACGVIFLVMNVAISAMMFYMIRQARVVNYHEVVVITMAAYTFFSFTMAIVNMVKYRKYASPVLSSAKAVSLSSACVSMLTLENTMLSAFNDGSMTETARRLFLGISGGVVSVFIILTAVWMVIGKNRRSA